MGVCQLPLPQLQAGCGVLGLVTHSVYNGVLGSIAKAAADAETEVLTLLTTGFLNVPTPDLSSGGSAVDFLQGNLQWLVAAIATVSLLVAAARLAWERKSDPAVAALAGIFRLIVVSGAGVAVVSLLLKAGDLFSTWVVDQATHDPTKSLTAIGDLTGTAFSSPFLVLVLASLGVLGFLVQLVLLLVRSALLVVLVGTWPLAAAASMTPSGAQWFRKSTAWIVAALLYKPAAGICFATAIYLMTSSTNGLGVIEGIALMLIATLALPALLKLVVPMAAGAGGISTAAVVGVAAGAATGAAMIAGAGSAVAAGSGASRAMSTSQMSKGGGSSTPPLGAAVQKSAQTGASRGVGAAQSAFTAAHQVQKLADGAIEGSPA